MDARDKTAALGMVNAAGDLVGKVKKAGTLYVFRLR
jgi:hypothetical protein